MSRLSEGQVYEQTTSTRVCADTQAVRGSGPSSGIYEQHDQIRPATESGGGRLVAFGRYWFAWSVAGMSQPSRYIGCGSRVLAGCLAAVLDVLNSQSINQSINHFFINI